MRPETLSAGPDRATTGRRGALAGLSLTMLMPSLATSIVNAGLPALTRTFAASFQAAQWIVLAYLLAITIAVVVAGRLGDIVGRKRLLLAGISVFTASSLLCAVAPTLPLLIVARAMQGLGAAAMMALTMAFAGDVVPAARLGRTMGLLGAMSAVGTTLGPSLGGLLLAFGGWPPIFLINAPLGAVAFLLVWRSLPADARPMAVEKRDVDIAGIILLSITLGAYALAMTIGRGDFGPLNVGLLLAACGAGGCLLLVEARAAVPLIRLSLFREPALGKGLVTGALVSTVMMATLIIGPFYLSGALGIETARLGIIASVGPLVAALAAMPAGRMADRFGTDRMVIAGLAAIMAGSLALCLNPGRPDIVAYVLPIILMTGGYALFQAANNTAIMTGAPRSQRGVVSGLLNLARNLGLVTGASAMGAVFALGVGSDVVTAPPDAIAGGMRVGFAVAALLVAIALALTVIRLAPSSPRPPNVRSRRWWDCGARSGRHSPGDCRRS